MKIKIPLKKVLEIVLDVCQGTLDGLENVQDKLAMVMKVLAFLMIKGEFDVEEPTGGRDLGLKLLADEVAARLKPQD